jgi:hypothetical protein
MSTTPRNELIERAKNHVVVEAHLTLTGGLRATHFLWIEGDDLYHGGIDGERQRLTPDEFMEMYPDSLGNVWTLDQAEEITIAVEAENGYHHRICTNKQTMIFGAHHAGLGSHINLI